MRRLGLLVLAWVSTGCQLFGPGVPAEEAALVDPSAEVMPDEPSAAAMVMLPELDARVTTSPDPLPVPTRIVELRMVEIRLPFGTVSNDAELWREIDEDVIELSTRDVLDKNGIRVGIIPASRMSKLDEYAQAGRDKRTLLGGQGRDMEVILDQGVPAQTLWWFDRRGELTGRSFDRAENLLAVSFRPAPRDPDAVLVQLAPMIRSERTIIEVTPSGRENQVTETRPETIYDLGLSVALPTDHVLILAPSAQGQWDGSVGARFMRVDEPSRRLERVWLIVPQVRALVERDQVRPDGSRPPGQPRGRSR
jgi:hypothetical protein